MPTITGIIIAKNEEKMIADCIDSLSFCDEIVLIDNKSSDNTSEIATKMKAKVFEFDTDDFSKLRNLGMEKAKGDYLFYVDADERVSLELAQEIKELISKDSEFSAYNLARKNFYLGNKPWPKIEWMMRLFKKNSLKGWYGNLHESPNVEGKVGELDNYLLHYAHRDLTTMLNKTINWSEIEAENRYNGKHPRMTWWRFPRVMIPVFLNYYIKQRGYKLGTVGLIESMFQSYSIFITYAKLWEKQRK